VAGGEPAPRIGQGGSRRSIGQSETGLNTTIRATRQVNERQLSRRGLVEPLFQLGPWAIFEFFEELINHGVLDEAVVGDGLALYAPLDPAILACRRRQISTATDSSRCRREPAMSGMPWNAPPVAWGDRLPVRQIKIRKSSPQRSRGLLLGFLDIELPSGMISRDWRLMTGRTDPWLAAAAQRQRAAAARIATVTATSIAAALGAALVLVSEGRPCFLCRTNKHPTTPPRFKKATCDANGLRDLWRRRPGTLVGLATGEASGFDALDLDRGHPEAGVRWAECRHRLPETRTHGTRSGDIHLLFRHTSALRCTAGSAAARYRGSAA